VRRQQPVERGGGARRASDSRPKHRRGGALSTYGDRPPGPFGGVPVSEIAILCGIVALVFGVINQGGPALIAGVVLCLLGVVEVTAREHFSGYRSHTVMLAAVPAVAAEFVVSVTVGGDVVRIVLLLPVAAVFAVCAVFLQKRFLAARQARIARPAKQ
jgi:hypothetical protein